MSNYNLATNSQVKKVLAELFPYNRSITGEGLKKTLNYIKKNFLKNAKIKKIRSGSKVFDWKVPFEWNIKEAYVKNKFGKKIIDFKKNNLHLISYSSSFKGIINKHQLKKKLHTIKEYPSRIPYRTSYYKKNWGFCCSHNLLKSKDFKGPFEVKIDASFNKKGNLLWLEQLKKGNSDKEILISSYCCHPSLGNDNLSGIVLSVLLFNYLKKIKTKFSYRLVLLPETIGAISFLSKIKKKKIKAGMILSCVGGKGKMSIKEGFDKYHWINKAAHKALKKFTNNSYLKYPFLPNGSDERQYSSPGFRIVTPSIHKSKYYEYSEYHTSADNLKNISASNILKTFEVYKLWIKNIESLTIPERKMKFCEYQLSKRNLYPSIGGKLKGTNKNLLDAFEWLMHLADGNNSNFDIAEKSGIKISKINKAINIFLKKKLISI